MMEVLIPYVIGFVFGMIAGVETMRLIHKERKKDDE